MQTLVCICSSIATDILSSLGVCLVNVSAFYVTPLTYKSMCTQKSWISLNVPVLLAFLRLIWSMASQN